MFISFITYYLHTNIYEIMYVILKMIPNDIGVKMPVIVLNHHHEIWEFDTLEEAEKMSLIFKENSDSGYDYVVRKI